MEMMEADDADEKAPLSDAEIDKVVSSSEDNENDQITPIEDNETYECSCNANIYNAFLIAKYRQDLKFKDHDFIKKDMQYGLGFFAYLIAMIQWVALITMILAFLDKTDKYSNPGVEIEEPWTIIPSDPWSWLLWPFFFIGLINTYKQLAQICVDVYILYEWDIRGNKFHVVMLKYLSEIVLYTVGSFAYYIALSFYSQSVEFLDVILKLLAYNFIFMADEWAYLLVKDIVKRRMIPTHCNAFFQGKRKGDISKYEMMICITIPLSVSFIVQGIYSKSYLTFGVGWLSIGLWTFDFWEEKFCSKQ